MRIKNVKKRFYYIFNEDSAIKLLEGVKTFSIIFIIGKWHPNLCNLQEIERWESGDGYC